MVAGGIGYLVAAASFWNWISSLQPDRTITVSGDGRAVLKPDIALISFSVVSEGKDITAMQDDNNQKINKAIELVKGLGVSKDDIKTSGYHLSPRYEYNKERQRSFISGYTLRQTVTVKIRDLDNVAKILGGLPSVGINELNGPNFTVDNPEEFLNAARAEAFKEAKKRAMELSALAGVRLGRVVGFNEGGGRPIPLYVRSFESVGGAPESVLPEIEPGTEEVTITVNVTYEIK